MISSNDPKEFATDSVRRATLLIVDDEPDLREALAFDFRKRGLNVLTAASGNEAFAFVQTQNIDLVLSDIRMADGDGFELLKKIKQRNALAPVVMFMTGFSEVSFAQAYILGAEAVFSKPFDRPKLLETIMKFLSPEALPWLTRPVRIREVMPIRVRFGHSDVSVTSKTWNMGRGGFFLSLTPPFPEKDCVLEFEIDYTSTTLVKIRGTGIVRWTRTDDESSLPAGCGVEFFNIEESSRENLNRLLSFLQEKYYIPTS